MGRLYKNRRVTMIGRDHHHFLLLFRKYIDHGRLLVGIRQTYQSLVEEVYARRDIPFLVLANNVVRFLQNEIEYPFGFSGTSALISHGCE